MGADYTLHHGLLKINKRVVVDLPLPEPLSWDLEESGITWAGIRNLSLGKRASLLIALTVSASLFGEVSFVVARRDLTPLWGPFPTLREALAFAYTHAIINQ